ncbi:lytic transglycosylase domain-containing protein [Xanthobacter flavus]|uniref:lytic transglycosylase domain-containing protein n=1 Tax=Xanthobacter flavus TaxID=281 RepID=UPI00372A761C
MPVAFADLAQNCAPTVQIETLAAVVSLESGFSPFAIRINSGTPLRDPPGSKSEAIEFAATLIAQGQDIALGLGGISVEDLGRQGLTVADVFDPCLNLKATARLLDGYYRVALGSGAAPAQATAVMLRAYYGRGDASVGELAGYDKQVRSEAQRFGPKLATLVLGGAGRPMSGELLPPRQQPAPPAAPQPQARRPVAPAPWDVFAIGRKSSALVFQTEQPE